MSIEKAIIHSDVKVSEITETEFNAIVAAFANYEEAVNANKANKPKWTEHDSRWQEWLNDPNVKEQNNKETALWMGFLLVSRNIRAAVAMRKSPELTEYVKGLPEKMVAVAMEAIGDCPSYKSPMENAKRMVGLAINPPSKGGYAGDEAYGWEGPNSQD